MLITVCEKLNNMREFDLDPENMDKKSVYKYYAKCAVSGIIEGAITACTIAGATAFISIAGAKLMHKM